MSLSEDVSRFNPKDNKKYNKKEYWDERYSTEESFDWFVGYDEIKELLQKYIKKTDRVLMLGCGNSSLSVDMYQDGFHDITNTDYSPTCIQKMSSKYETSLPGMSWLVMDAKNLDFDDASFDVILEKGMFDALMVTEDSPWTVSTESKQCFQQILTEVSRVLKDDGRFVSITFAQPHFRSPHYAQAKYNWSLIQDTIETPGKIVDYFCYTMTKGNQLTTEQMKNAETFFNPEVPDITQVSTYMDVEETEEDLLKSFLSLDF